MKVELQNSIEFTEKVRNEMNTQIQKYTRDLNAGNNQHESPTRKPNKVFRFQNGGGRRRISSIYQMPETSGQSLFCQNETGGQPAPVADNAMEFNGSFQQEGVVNINLNNT